MKYETQQYHPVDIVFTSENEVVQPFYVDVKGVFRGPNGRVIEIPGFYDGDMHWKIRFAPDVVGEWSYMTISSFMFLDDICGTVLCIVNTNPNVHGGVVIDPDSPSRFKYEDGKEHVMFSYEINWLYALGFHDPEIEKIKECVTDIIELGFNNVVVNAYGHDCGWSQQVTEHNYGPSAMYLWGGSNEDPDHDCMNMEYFRNYDRMMQYLHEQGVTLHMFFRSYNKLVTHPVRFSKQDDLYFKYLVARYQAYNVIWDFAKETLRELDKDYIRSRLLMVRAADGYHRLVTAHEDPVFYETPAYRKLVDFVTLERHNEVYLHTRSIREKLSMPVFVSEYGYECGPGGLDDKSNHFISHTAEVVISKMYDIIMAGGFPGYYYANTAWAVIDYKKHPKGYDYIRILKKFFDALPLSRMTPYDEYVSFSIGSGVGNTRALAIRNEEYVFYVPSYSLVILSIKNIGDYEGTKINTLTGQRESISCEILTDADLENSAAKKVSDHPMILHIKKKM